MDTTKSHPIVSACAESRATAGNAPYTVRCAIEDARRLRSTPDAILDTPGALRMIDTLLAALEANTCYLNAMMRGKRVFVLAEQDRAAPEAIQKWADEATAHGCPEAKILDARRTATEWAAQDLSLTKWPD